MAHQTIKALEELTLPSDSEIQGLSEQDALKKAEDFNGVLCAIYDAQDEEAAKSGSAEYELTKTNWEKAADVNRAIEALEHHVSDIRSRNGLRKAAEERRKESRRAVNNGPLPGSEGEEKKDGSNLLVPLGKLFYENPEVKEFFERQFATAKHVNGQLSKFDSPSVDAGSLMERLVALKEARRKNLFTGGSDTSAGAFIETDRTGIYDDGPFRRVLTLLDLIPRLTTKSDNVDYVVRTALTINAGTTPEATSTADANAIPGQSSGTWERKSTPVREISHYMQVTRQALADEEQMQQMMNSDLFYGLEYEAEEQVAAGDGNDSNLLGVQNNPGIATQAFDEDLIKTARKGRTKVRIGGRAKASAYVMNPTTWETIDLLQDNEKRYYYGGPAMIGTPRLWGLPVVECEAWGTAKGMVADWRFARLWDRKSSEILISNSHDDLFLKQIATVLAIMRLAFALIRPKAFVELNWQ